MIPAHRTDRGSITGYVAVLALALIMVAGMAYDGGQLIAARAQARSHASGAARAAAQELDLDVLRQTGEARLDPSRAEAAAHAYLAAAGTSGVVAIEGDTATVTVTVVHQMLILPLADRRVTSTDAATAVSGHTVGDAGGDP